jgi:hypothetical protein
VILGRLEQMLLPQQPPGTLKPCKKVVKGLVDVSMRSIIEQNEAAKAVEAAAPPEPEATPSPMEEEAPAAADAVAEKPPAAAANEAPAVRDADPAASGDEDHEAPPGKRRRVEEAESPAAAEGGEGGGNEEQHEEEEEDDDDDPDAPRVTGKPMYKLDGKSFYKKMTKGDVVMEVGQDVYLENNQDIPYVARLQEIFVYSFAPSEVYFNARWYYRVGDVHEYARMSGATRDVEFDGGELMAEAKELFFSLHMDENHADCILRSCSVHLLRGTDPPPSSAWNAVTDAHHEYIAWRAYDNKHVYSLHGLPSKKLKDACELECKRGPQKLAREAAAAASKRREDLYDEPAGPLRQEELLSIWLPRKHLEIWITTNSFTRVVTGTLVRISQMINGKRSFYAAYVMEVKRAQRPYRLGDQICDVALKVRTQTGNRLIGIDALSNAPCTEPELGRFKVPLDPEAVRKKMRTLQRAMQEDSDLFEEQELRERAEQQAAAEKKREDEARARAAAEAEKERREREKEEVRRRQAAHREDSDAWWLQYQTKAGDKEREIGKLKARLARFQKIVATSEAEGERVNAQRLAEQAQGKLDSLLAANDE